MAEVYELFPGIKAGEETDKARAERCMSRVIEVLQEENCGLLPDFRLVGATVSAGITIIAKPLDVPTTTLN